MFGAYVQWESKKGKWSKRWLETRNGHFFLSKSDKVRGFARRELQGIN